MHETSVDDHLTLNGPTSSGKTSGFDGWRETVSSAELDQSGNVLNIDRHGDHPATQWSSIVKDCDALSKERFTTDGDLTTKDGGKLSSQRFEASILVPDVLLGHGSWLGDVVWWDAICHGVGGWL